MIENTLWMTYFEYLPIELKAGRGKKGKNGLNYIEKKIEENYSDIR